MIGDPRIAVVLALIVGAGNAWERHGCGVQEAAIDELLDDICCTLDEMTAPAVIS